MRPASVNSRTGYRQYLPQQLEQIASILALKNLGVPPAQLSKLAAKRGAPVDRRAILNNLKQKIEHSIQTAARSLNWSNAALDEVDNYQSPTSVIVKRRPAIRIASIRVSLGTMSKVRERIVECVAARLCRSVARSSVAWLRGFGIASLKRGDNIADIGSRPSADRVPQLPVKPIRHGGQGHAA